MKKTMIYLVAAMFAVPAASAFAAEKGAKKPTAAECKKDPKMPGCEEMKKKK